MKDWEKNDLYTLSDSFPSRQVQDPALAPGNYLLVQSRGSYLAVTLRTMGPLRYDLLNNGPNASLLLHTPNGGTIKDAEVHVRHLVDNPRSIHFITGRDKRAGLCLSGTTGCHHHRG
jgi:hypothetical protein